MCVPGWFGAGGQVWSLFRKVGSMIRQADQLDKPQAREAVVSLSLGRFCGMGVFLDCMYWKSIHTFGPRFRGGIERKAPGESVSCSRFDGEVGVMGSELSGGVRGNEQTANAQAAASSGH